MNEPMRDPARRILELEQRLAAYQKLHAEEIDELRQLLLKLTKEVLASQGRQRIEADSAKGQDGQDANRRGSDVSA